jgi:hypothetical protein
VFTPVIGWLSDRYDFRYSFAFIAMAIVALTLICGVILVILRKESRGAGVQSVSRETAKEPTEG